MSEWARTTLGKVLSAGGGKIQTGPFGSQLHAADYVQFGIPCIMPANMKNNRVDLSGIARISQKDAERLSQHLVQEGDIIYSRRGDVTQKALIRKDEAGYFCGTGCLLIRPGSNIDSEFLTYHLSTPSNQEWIVQKAVGATMPNLNTGILAEVPLMVPGKPTQQRVATVLSALDAKIECNNRINVELEAMAKTLYDYWFVQFDFPDENGKPYKSSGGRMIYNPSLQREIPAGWQDGVLAEIAELYQPRTISEKEMSPDAPYLVYGANGIVGRYSEYNHEDSVVAIACRGNSCGMLNITRPFSWITGNAMVVNSKGKSVACVDYLFHTLKRSGVEKIITGSAQPQITRTNLAPLKILIPPVKLVADYSVRIDPSFRHRLSNLEENEKLTHLRDWLLPMLMNGQVTVAEGEAES